MLKTSAFRRPTARTRFLGVIFIIELRELLRVAEWAFSRKDVDCISDKYGVLAIMVSYSVMSMSSGLFIIIGSSKS